MRLLLTAFFALCTGLCFAQKNFQPGLFVSNSGDTIKGFINYPEREKNPQSFQFSTSPDGIKAETYSVKDVAHFEITGFEKYQRCQCVISLSQVATDKFPTGRDTTTKTDVIFLRTLILGKNVNLYSYQDEIKTRFYISTLQQPGPTELYYRPYLSQEFSGKIMEDFYYKQQLSFIATITGTEDQKFKRFVEKAQYRKHSLIETANYINQEKSRTAIYNRTYRSNRYFAGLGFHHALFRFKGSSINSATGFVFPSHNGPALTLGFDHLFNPNIGRAYLRQELSIFQNKHIGKRSVLGNNYQYNLQQQIASIGSAYLYNLYHKPNFRIFMGVGFAFNFIHYKANQIEDENKNSSLPVLIDELDLAKYNITGNGRAGFRLYDKLDASFVLSLPITYVANNYTAVRDIYQYQQFKLAYVFGTSRRK